ncbi:Retrovirus-related Pol polyprotein from transposon TNT [Fusarium oxysporum f. sp. conglutinans]|nr:Retrovirus-related Pol polyprotein from transposon TNT [Fusarium oxysporum f. sp. conglutinans]
MTSAKLPDLRKEVITEPKTMTEALQGPQREHWLRAIHSELRSLLTKGTWRMLDRNQAHNRPLTVKWVFKVKKNEDGNLDKFKARLVVRGFEQQFGFDYNQTFASVAKAATSGESSSPLLPVLIGRLSRWTCRRRSWKGTSRKKSSSKCRKGLSSISTNTQKTVRQDSQPRRSAN